MLQNYNKVNQQASIENTCSSIKSNTKITNLNLNL